MISTSTVLIFTAAANFLIGLLVYLNNPKRAQNGQLLLFSVNVSVWGLAMANGISAQTQAQVEWYIRITSYLAALIPVTFYMLCLAIDEPGIRPRTLIIKARHLLVLSQVIGLLSFTPYYLQAAVMPHAPGQIAEARYGWAFGLYNIYFLVTFGWILFRFTSLMRRSTGVKRQELQYVVLGFSTTLLIALTTQILIPSLTGSSKTQPFGPLSILAMNGIFAYGIATERIMGVGHILRRITAYLILIVYLGLIYTVSWYFFSAIIPTAPDIFPLPHLLAAIIVALSLAPAHGRLQQFANRLFINVQSVAVEPTLQEANRILQSVARLDSLLSQFGALIERAFGTDRVVLLVRRGEAYEQFYPPPDADGAAPVRVMHDTPLAALLAAEPDPLVNELITRRRPTPELLEISRQLDELGVSAAVGIHYKEYLDGIMLLGPRLSGRIYGATEQDVLRLLGNQLGVAIENAKLYTEVQDAKIYNNILLDNLDSGVIAANRERKITVFNREAQRIMELDPETTVGQAIDVLPHPIRQALDATLRHQRPVREHDHSVNVDDTTRNIRLSTTTVHSYQNDFIGALAVFHDTTRMKALEEQVRRHDRLASIGTLSAGMAHEIKNPLVSIKTFTELLPERYTDPEFREKFSTLVGAEVRRIDRIVNQLLRFARPAKANLAPNSLHRIIEECLSIVDQQLIKKDIRVIRNLHAPHDCIDGDPNLLQQVFINFFLNAIDSMDRHGRLTIRTQEGSSSVADGDVALRQKPPKQSISVTIADTGIGIPESDIPHVFDPFFTTKDGGTGLGLAVAHGILAEHHAATYVRSRVGEGTVFEIVFPLHYEKVVA